MDVNFKPNMPPITSRQVSKADEPRDKSDSHGSDFYEKIEKERLIEIHGPHPNSSRPQQTFTGDPRVLDSLKDVFANGPYCAKVMGEIPRKIIPNIIYSLNQFSGQTQNTERQGQFTIYGASGLYAIGRGDR
ncbi:hypothetical protein HNV12_02710 [Methanococcoides sp. SA1]|nr:hypothetical protein [Methanococcoides sp. SA1]